MIESIESPWELTKSEALVSAGERSRAECSCGRLSLGEETEMWRSLCFILKWNRSLMYPG